MDRQAFDAKREVEELVGEYRDRSGTPGQRWGRLALKLVAGAALAVAAMFVVMKTLDVHLVKAKTQAAKGESQARKPVPVQIVPAQK